MSTTDNTMNLDIPQKEVAARIRDLREIEGLTQEEMAERTGISFEQYEACEAGDADLTFAFLYRCAISLKVDVTDFIEGTTPRLTSYVVTRAGKGQRIQQAHGMVYYSLAHTFRNRTTEPLQVHAIYDPILQDQEIEATSHEGQECDIVVSGTLKIRIGEHTVTLEEGDSVYYDSSTPHGMIATSGKDCVFYAIVIDPSQAREQRPGRVAVEPLEQVPTVAAVVRTGQRRIYHKYVDRLEDENGILQSIAYKNLEDFNFGYDVVDAIAEKEPGKLAMLHVASDKTERHFTFEDVSRLSNRAANLFTSLGIQRGDRVLLVLKRNYQFWISTIALHKIGAIVIPATDQLLEKDYVYRFEAAGISAIIATADNSNAPEEADKAIAQCPGVKIKIIACGEREGWVNFDEQTLKYRSSFSRPENCACGSDQMLMFFTSGTTGYPKIAVHNFKYPVGHFITAKYWQCVDPNGLHLTISDTGWAKAMWGKLYGQWLCEAPIFVYDFVRFDANDILPMFEKYKITTFCAPPTMYRFLIREDLSRFDLSSVKNATIAGEALNPEVFYQFQEATGLALMEGFGQSESSVIVANISGMAPKPGSMGKPVPQYDVDIVDANCRPLPIGEVGEIVIRTKPGEVPGLVIEYYRDPKNTEKVWQGGVYHTGDMAWKDEDGYIWYVGRGDDLIKSSGYRIGPFEIESVIMELPYVLECGVSAVPDKIRGQIVKASIVLTRGKEGSDELAKEIQDYVKLHTAPYKYPRIVTFCETLPKTISGKIQRSLL